MKAVRSFLREYDRKYRVTILLTSHYMADIQELCVSWFSSGNRPKLRAISCR